MQTSQDGRQGDESKHNLLRYSEQPASQANLAYLERTAEDNETIGAEILKSDGIYRGQIHMCKIARAGGPQFDIDIGDHDHRSLFRARTRSAAARIEVPIELLCCPGALRVGAALQCIQLAFEPPAQCLGLVERDVRVHACAHAAQSKRSWCTRRACPAMRAIHASRASQRGHAALRALVRRPTHTRCGGGCADEAGADGAAGVKRPLNACSMLQGLWGGILGASELLALLLTAIEYSPRESYWRR